MEQPFRVLFTTRNSNVIRIGLDHKQNKSPEIPVIQSSIKSVTGPVAKKN